MQNYFVLAFYLFVPIENPKAEVKRWKRFLSELDAMGRIYLNEEGINAQMSVSQEDASRFYDWFLGDSRFKETDIKVHTHDEQAFPKLTVKYRQQLVALDESVDMAKGGKHLSAKEWKAMLDEENENTVVLDVRNGYEWDVGHFEGAKRPNFQTFREFPESVKELKKKHDPKRSRVMMYCTGGIRCELYSCLLKEEGFEEVYQLDGGVIKYGLEEGSEHWKGKLFVFDDRLVVPISEEDSGETISQCSHCKKATDTYYNCANMDCNALFLCCLDCCEKMKGCCCESCVEAPRRRTSEPSLHPKPFRKLPHEEKVKLGPE